MTGNAFHREDIARAAIDRKLAECGWLVQSRSDWLKDDALDDPDLLPPPMKSLRKWSGT